MLSHNDPKNNTEVISDSLAKVLREYNEHYQKLSFWNKKPDTEELQRINRLRILLQHSASGFLESQQKLLEEIRKISQDRASNLNHKPGHPIVDKVFIYLDERIKYHDIKQRRMPDALTNTYKILLVGDGWVQWSDKDNPLIKDINNELKSTNPHKVKSAEMTLAHFNLENRGFLPNQVYTIDRLSTSLPDLCSSIEELKPEILPNDFFDFAYFEGFGFTNEEEAKHAINTALATLKKDGVLLYHTNKPSNDLILIAKTGAITQEKLEQIPVCVKQSANRLLSDYYSFEEVTANQQPILNLTDETRKKPKNNMTLGK
jgi:hypothetical protein